jgi:hypothetical protein
MPCAIPLAVREQIILLHQQHYSAVAISEQLQVNVHSVRRLIQHYKADHARSLQPAYSNCGVKKLKVNAALLRAGLWLKRLHPYWGAPCIHLQLIERYGEQQQGMPAVRTLQQWMRTKGLNRPREQHPAVDRGWAVAPHHVWQVDAKERLVLDNKQPACYLTISDEHSGACLQTLVFPL